MPKGGWTDGADRQLLLIMVHLAPGPLPKWDEVAKLMGEDYTAEAVRQHFQKLRKKCTQEFGERGSTSTDVTEKPAGRKTAKTVTKRKAKCELENDADAPVVKREKSEIADENDNSE